MAVPDVGNQNMVANVGRYVRPSLTLIPAGLVINSPSGRYSGAPIANRKCALPHILEIRFILNFYW